MQLLCYYGMDVFIQNREPSPASSFTFVEGAVGELRCATKTRDK
jgi:hypothetical protein